VVFFALLENREMLRRIGDEESESRRSAYIVLPETMSESGELSNFIS
jgi:hypothetical protein